MATSLLLALGFKAMGLGIGEGILLGLQIGVWRPIFYDREEIMLVLLLMD